MQDNTTYNPDNGYIDITQFQYQPITDIEIGKEVIYQNGNGCWYKGKIDSEEKNHQCMLYPDKKNGIIVEFSDMSLILQKSQLFEITDWR